MVALDPGLPSVLVTETPDTSPINACATLDTAFASMFSLLTTLSVPVKDFFVVVP